MESVIRTDRGIVRAHNEDYGAVYANQYGDLLAVVADGMGGHNAGEVASQMTANLLEEAWKDSEKISEPVKAEEWFRAYIPVINRKIYEKASLNSEMQGMGTTLVAAICTHHFVTIANVGDSRCYLADEHGLKQITEDHSLVNELVKIGSITKEEAANHPRKNVVLRAIGTEPTVKVDVQSLTFSDGDYLLLCSDGLTDKVKDSKIEEILLSDQKLEAKANSFIELANKNGGEDNITVVIIYNKATEKAGD